MAYLKSGIMRPSLDELYWKLAELRRNIALARLGITCQGEQSSNDISGVC